MALFISALAFSANLVAAGEKPTLERKEGISSDRRDQNDKKPTLERGQGVSPSVRKGSKD